MITLALAQMMFFFAVQAPFTHGEDGIQAVPRGKLFGLIDLADPTNINMYATVLVIFLICFLLIYRVINSPFGEVLKAIRENESRAISLGYKTDRYKLVAFVLSATFAGVAGASKALVFQLASLTDVDWPMSGEVILMTLVVLRGLAGELSHHPVRPMGARGPGADLRALRHGAAARSDRRAREHPAHQAVGRCVT
jgi:branched-chain amino acid transport system permease protein